GWGSDQIWPEPQRELAPGRGLCRQDPQGRQARRPADRAADPVRARRQPQHRERARAYNPAVDPRPRRRGHRMTRREFLAALLLAANSGGARAQAQEGRVPVVGVVSAASREPRLSDAFLAGLREHGYIEGQNIRVEFRYA